jgi:molecular chaperone GrpE
MAEEPVATAATDDERPASEPDQRPASEPDQRLLRALADLDNLRKRVDREVTRQRAEERADVAQRWLPVVDDLERALEYAGSSDDPLVAGVRATFERALLVLDQLGFPRFDDVGAPFDPTRHEAVGTIDTDAAPGTVAATTRAGYGSDQAVLRPASVIVARRPEPG